MHELKDEVRTLKAEKIVMEAKIETLKHTADDLRSSRETAVAAAIGQAKESLATEISKAFKEGQQFAKDLMREGAQLMRA